MGGSGSPAAAAPANAAAPITDLRSFVMDISFPARLLVKERDRIGRAAQLDRQHIDAPSQNISRHGGVERPAPDLGGRRRRSALDKFAVGVEKSLDRVGLRQRLTDGPMTAHPVPIVEIRARPARRRRRAGRHSLVFHADACVGLHSD